MSSKAIQIMQHKKPLSTLTIYNNCVDKRMIENQQKYLFIFSLTAKINLQF